MCTLRSRRSGRPFKFTAAAARVAAAAIISASALLAGATSAFAFDPRPDASGFEVDLLPVAASATEGRAGGAVQLWIGAERNRLRLVGAHLHYPGSFVDAPFADRSSTVAALLYDRFFRDDYSGPWVAVGGECWWSRIGLKAGEEHASWSTPVATVGAGWVFPVWRGLYLNPWAAVHGPVDAGAVAVGSERYRPERIESEASVKIGWRRISAR
jgi:hypothetical protein